MKKMTGEDGETKKWEKNKDGTGGRKAEEEEKKLIMSSILSNFTISIRKKKQNVSSQRR